MKTIFRTMFLAGALVAVAGCGNNEKNTETVKVVDDTPTVSVVQVGVQNVPQDVTYTSTVQPFVKNNIVPQGGNRIKKINVEVGDFVKQGQVLAEMDMTQLQQAELQLVNNEIEYNRLKTLYEAGGLSKSDLDAIEINKAAAHLVAKADPSVTWTSSKGKVHDYTKPNKSRYMFRVKPSEGVRSGEIRVKDNFGKEYTCKVEW